MILMMLNIRESVSSLFCLQQRSGRQSDGVRPTSQRVKRLTFYEQDNRSE